MLNKERINVTKTFLPPKEEYQALLDRVWESNWITNHGPLVTEFEAKLKEHLGVKHLFFVANGTIALQIAMSRQVNITFALKPFCGVMRDYALTWLGNT